MSDRSSPAVIGNAAAYSTDTGAAVAGNCSAAVCTSDNIAVVICHVKRIHCPIYVCFKFIGLLFASFCKNVLMDIIFGGFAF